MSDFFLRKYIRAKLFEYYNNAGIYAYGRNKFPYFDKEDITPSDLAAEFAEEFQENKSEDIESSDVEDSEKNFSDSE